MKVSELANELGKTSKEVLDIVKQKDQSASLFAASSLSGDQEAMVRAAVSQKGSSKGRTCKEEADRCIPSTERTAADKASCSKAGSEKGSSCLSSFRSKGSCSSETRGSA